MHFVFAWTGEEVERLHWADRQAESVDVALDVDFAARDKVKSWLELFELWLFGHVE